MVICMITGFCHKVGEICTLLGYYTAYSGNSLPITIIHCIIS